MWGWSQQLRQSVIFTILEALFDFLQACRGSLSHVWFSGLEAWQACVMISSEERWRLHKFCLFCGRHTSKINKKLALQRISRWWCHKMFHMFPRWCWKPVFLLFFWPLIIFTEITFAAAFLFLLVRIFHRSLIWAFVFICLDWNMFFLLPPFLPPPPFFLLMAQPATEQM